MRDIKTETEFNDAISEGITVIKFYTNWCPDCHRIDPFLPEVVKNYEDQINFVQIDRDVLPELSQKLDVFGIPSFIAFKDGQETIRFVSRQGKTREEIENFLNRVIEVSNVLS